MIKLPTIWSTKRFNLKKIFKKIALMSKIRKAEIEREKARAGMTSTTSKMDTYDNET
jgi:hypothetical protein